jgi:hypothetical protein
MSLEFLNNKDITFIITGVLGLYISLLGPCIDKDVQIPDNTLSFVHTSFIHKIFNNVIFRIIILFLIVVSGNKNPTVSILIAMTFLLTLDKIYIDESKEAFRNI